MWKELLEKSEAVLFDLDGTVIDSMWVWRQIDIDYFASQGMVYPEDYQDLIEGMSVYETAVFTKQTYGVTSSVDEILEIWDDMAFEQYANNIPLKPGAMDFLLHLQAQGKKLGIVTSNSTKLCNVVLNKHNIKDFFGVIITGESNIAGKPAPDVYLKAAHTLNIKPEKCLVFEDLVNGIKAGNAANMITIAVKDEYSEKHWDIKTEVADYYINDYKEIMNEIFNT